MNLDEFKIGETFFASAGFEWLCTDKGTRTITAIMLDPDGRKKAAWVAGPPYALEEEVFDEYDMTRCYSHIVNMVQDRHDSMDTSAHPGFLSDDVFKMMKAKDHHYPHKKLMSRDRVGQDGAILHPYSAIKKENGWHIKIFEIFTCQYSDMHEDEFVELPYSSEEAMLKRKNSL